MNTKARALESGLKGLVGRRCIGVAAGWGSYLGIDFEPRFPRLRPVGNPHLPPTLRKYIGEISLFVTGAAWRLTSSGAISVGSLDRLRLPAVQTSIRKIEGRRVRLVAVAQPGWVLRVEFDRGLTFEVFPVASRFDKEGDNYTCLLPTKSIAVLGGGRVDVEESNRWRAWRNHP